MEDLYQVIQNYPPGQNNVDGGGFEIKQYDPQKGYLYVQFESLKNGYIDDFEAAYIDDTNSNSNEVDENENQTRRRTPTHPKNAMQIRSSSRVGYLDYGVNAKRINYIAHQLQNPPYNWPSVEGVKESTHRRYYIENEI